VFSVFLNDARSDDGLDSKPELVTTAYYRRCFFMTVYSIHTYAVLHNGDVSLKTENFWKKFVS